VLGRDLQHEFQRDQHEALLVADVASHHVRFPVDDHDARVDGQHETRPPDAEHDLAAGGVPELGGAEEPRDVVGAQEPDVVVAGNPRGRALGGRPSS
jgi:hypothetical protein